MADGLNTTVNMNWNKFKMKVIFYILLFSIAIIIGLTNSSKADNHDLSGQKAPIIAVVEGDTIILNDGTRIKESEFSETVSKTEDVLDKLQKIEKVKGKVHYDKTKIIKPRDVADTYCFVKVVIKQQGDNLVKEEILECADGRKTFDGPSYWELFAQFYYRDISAPEYCRYYSRPKHVFKSFGKTCLNKNGEWEVQ